MVKERIKQRLSRQFAKEILTGAILKGLDPSDLKSLAQEFSHLFLNLVMNRKTALLLSEARTRGERVIIISASPELYLREIANTLGTELLCTRLETGHDGKFTGKLLGQNCRGEEKVKRLKELLNPEEYSPIRAYGDSDGDTELLKLAHEPHYREGRGLSYLPIKTVACLKLYAKAIRGPMQCDSLPL